MNEEARRRDGRRIVNRIVLSFLVCWVLTTLVLCAISERLSPMGFVHGLAVVAPGLGI